MSRLHVSQLYLHSFDATNAGEIYNFKLNRILRHVHEIRIKRILVPFSYYVFTSVNNQLRFTETAGGGEVTSTITPGNYTATQLEAEIKTQMEADSINLQTYTITISTNTYLLTIASPSFSLNFDFATSAFCQLGYLVDSTTGAATSHISPRAVNLNGPLMLFIKSSELTTGASSRAIFRNVSSNVVAGISVDVGPNTVILSQFGIANTIESLAKRDEGTGVFRTNTEKSGKTIRDIDITIVDHINNIINLNGRHFIIDIDIISHSDL